MRMVPLYLYLLLMVLLTMKKKKKKITRVSQKQSSLFFHHQSIEKGEEGLQSYHNGSEVLLSLTNTIQSLYIWRYILSPHPFFWYFLHKNLCGSFHHDAEPSMAPLHVDIALQASNCFVSSRKTQRQQKESSSHNNKNIKHNYATKKCYIRTGTTIKTNKNNDGITSGYRCVTTMMTTKQ